MTAQIAALEGFSLKESLERWMYVHLHEESSPEPSMGAEELGSASLTSYRLIMGLYAYLAKAAFCKQEYKAGQRRIKYVDIRRRVRRYLFSFRMMPINSETHPV